MALQAHEQRQKLHLQLLRVRRVGCLMRVMGLTRATFRRAFCLSCSRLPDILLEMSGASRLFSPAATYLLSRRRETFSESIRPDDLEGVGKGCFGLSAREGFFEEAALMMKLPKRHATPWEGGRLAPITIVISRG
jgi:hypothetical protein